MFPGKISMLKITKEMLSLYDEYEGGSLLSEPWVPEAARVHFQTLDEPYGRLGEYINKMYFVRVKSLSPELRAASQQRIDELEQYIDDEVVRLVEARTARD